MFVMRQNKGTTFLIFSVAKCSLRHVMWCQIISPNTAVIEVAITSGISCLYWFRIIWRLGTLGRCAELTVISVAGLFDRAGMPNFLEGFDPQICTSSPYRHSQEIYN